MLLLGLFRLSCAWLRNRKVSCGHQEFIQCSLSRFSSAQLRLEAKGISELTFKASIRLFSE